MATNTVGIDKEVEVNRKENLRDHRLYWIGRRTQDIILSSVALVVLSPVMLATAIAIVVDDPSAGPVFSQERIGRNGKVVFVSSGGTVYGKEVDCPLKEKTATNPISSYGVQKITIEKLLYLYRYMYGLDYRIIRLANPYGPYQRPNGVLGAVTTFTYKALKGDEITVYGDGSVVRDFIYIDDAIRAIMKIVNGENKHRTFNLGCGYGTSIKQVLETIEKALGIKLNVSYLEGRKVDVPVNYLDISRYEKYYGALNPISLEDGIRKTADFMKKEYGI